MKTIIRMVAAVLVLCSMAPSFADELSDAKEAFKKKHDELFKSGNGTEYIKLFYTNGEPANLHHSLGASMEHEESILPPITDYSSEFVPLPTDYSIPTVVENGKRREPNLEPIALLHITGMRSKGGPLRIRIDLKRPIGVADGKVYLVGTKITDVEAPKDAKQGDPGQTNRPAGKAGG